MTSGYVVGFVFFVFIVLDQVSFYPRFVCSVLRLNAIGGALQNMVNTVKRFTLVLLAPTLGYVGTKMSEEGLLEVIVSSIAYAVLGFVFCFLFRDFVFSFFERLAVVFNESGFKIRYIFKSFYCLNVQERVASERLKPESGAFFSAFSFKVFGFSFFISLLYFNVAFIINIVGLIYPEESSVIYQMNGVVTALGTVLLAFWLDPLLSRGFDREEGLWSNFLSVLLGKFFALLASFLSFLIYGLSG